MGRLDDLKRQVSIKQLLLHYGWDGHARGIGEWKTTLCPFHKDTNPSGSVNLGRNRFHCFTCGVRGDIIDIVKTQEGIHSVREAAEWIEQRFSVG